MDTETKEKGAGYIYLLVEREFLRCRENVLKVGKTRQADNARFQGYPKGSFLLLQTLCSDSDRIERELLQLFRTKYKSRQDVGSEYFEGDSKEMMRDIIRATDEIGFSPLASLGGTHLHTSESRAHVPTPAPVVVDKISSSARRFEGAVVKTRIVKVLGGISREMDRAVKSGTGYVTVRIRAQIIRDFFSQTIRDGCARHRDVSLWGAARHKLNAAEKGMCAFVDLYVDTATELRVWNLSAIMGNIDSLISMCSNDRSIATMDDARASCVYFLRTAMLNLAKC